MAMLTRSAPYYPALDGLRGAGISVMLLYHLDLGVGSGAFLALSMFFTLSGFLIGSQLLDAQLHRGGIDFRRFWERRIRRLMPASTLALLAAALYTGLLARPDEVPAFSGDIVASLFYVPNWRFVVTGQTYEAMFITPSPVQHFWSLGVEEQFYVALPLMIALLVGRGHVRRFVVVLVVLIASSTAWMAALRAPGSSLGHAYYGTDARAAELLVGVLLGLWVGGTRMLDGERTKLTLNVLGGISLLAMLILWNTTSETQLWFYRGGALGYSSICAAIMLACLVGGPVARLLSLRPLTYLGDVSYGLYVYHWPIYLAIDRADLTACGHVAAILKLGSTLAVAIASYHLVERPIRSRRALIGPRQWWAPPVAMAIVLSASLVLVGLRAEEGPPLELRTVDVGGVTHGAREIFASPRGPDTRPRVLLAGNSLATGVGLGLQQWGDETGLAEVEVWSVPGCGLLQRPIRRKNPLKAEKAERMTARCRELNDALSDWPGHPPDIVVLLFGGRDLGPGTIDEDGGPTQPGDAIFDDRLVERYTEVADHFIDLGAHVVWLTFPCADRERNRSREPISLESPIIRHYNDALLPRVHASRPGTTSVLDLERHVCPREAFEATIGGVQNARPDGTHFSAEGGRALADWLGPAVLEASGAR